MFLLQAFEQCGSSAAVHRDASPREQCGVRGQTQQAERGIGRVQRQTQEQTGRNCQYGPGEWSVAIAGGDQHARWTGAVSMATFHFLSAHWRHQTTFRLNQSINQSSQPTSINRNQSINQSSQPTSINCNQSINQSIVATNINQSQSSKQSINQRHWSQSFIHYWSNWSWNCSQTSLDGSAVPVCSDNNTGVYGNYFKQSADGNPADRLGLGFDRWDQSKVSCLFSSSSMWMSMDEYGWVWMSMDEYGWVWMGMDGYGWVWMSMDEYGWVWMGMDGYGWVWMGMDGYGWVWMGMDGYGWVWMSMDEYGWVWMSMDEYGWVWMGIPVECVPKKEQNKAK